MATLIRRTSGAGAELVAFFFAVLRTTAQRNCPGLYPLLLVMARTGLRLGEALALRSRISTSRGAICGAALLGTREAELWRGPDRLAEEPPAPARGHEPAALRRSQAYLGVREAEAILRGHAASPWLFEGPEGGPMTRNQFQPRWRRLLKAAGLRPRKAHTLRHTFASHLIQNGESLAYVRDQLGHHSIKMTVDVYGHLLPGDKAALDRLDTATTRNPAATVPASPERNGQLAGLSS
jgi:integrase